MPILSLVNVRHAYGSRVILDGATLSVEPGERIGLVGRNGTGKSTLMRIVSGSLAPDAGMVQVQRGARVGWLAQDPRFEAGDTLHDAAERAFAHLHELHAELHRVFEAMGGADGAELERLMRRQGALEAQIEAEGGYVVEHRIDATLHGLGFVDAQFAQPVETLSGGQRSRLALARLLLEAPDLLLLDEPTNHLDIDGRRWLESFLAADFPGAVVLVSHDRRLLDRVVTRIVEIEHAGLNDYPGNYSRHIELRRERAVVLQRQYEKQQDRIRQERDFIARYKAGQRARQAKGRESRLERFIRDEVVAPPPEASTLRMRLPSGPRSGDLVLVAEGLAKSYDGRTLFRDLDVSIGRGDRVGIVGPNGAGKTTLLRCLLGEIAPDAGRAAVGSRVSVGHFRQSHAHLEPSQLVWEYLQSVIKPLDGADRASEQQARDVAGAFLFSGLEQDRAIGDLSGGERTRLVLAGIVAGGHNLLVLDEPTNHLDLPSAERLEEVLASEDGFDGAVLLVTHDRALLDAVCTSLLIVGDGGVRAFPGTWSEWETRLAEETAAADEARKAKAKRAPRPEAKPRRERAPAGPFAKLSLPELEKRIESLELRRDEIDRRLGEPEVYREPDRVRELTDERDGIARELEPLETEWLRRAEEA